MVGPRSVSHEKTAHVPPVSFSQLGTLGGVDGGGEGTAKDASSSAPGIFLPGRACKKTFELPDLT